MLRRPRRGYRRHTHSVKALVNQIKKKEKEHSRAWQAMAGCLFRSRWEFRPVPVAPPAGCSLSGSPSRRVWRASSSSRRWCRSGIPPQPQIRRRRFARQVVRDRAVRFVANLHIRIYTRSDFRTPHIRDNIIIRQGGSKKTLTNPSL